jgi:hypothetical protein
VIANGALFFMSNPNLQEWGGHQVTAAPEGEELRVMWIPIASGTELRR